MKITVKRLDTRSDFEELPLFMQYPNEGWPQDAYLFFDTRDGSLEADIWPERGNSYPMGVHDGWLFWFLLNPYMREEDVLSLLNDGELHDALSRLQEVVEDEEADLAELRDVEDEVQNLVSRWVDQCEKMQVWDAIDYFDGEEQVDEDGGRARIFDYVITSGTSDGELDRIAQELEEDARREGFFVLDIGQYLYDLRDDQLDD